MALCRCLPVVGDLFGFLTFSSMFAMYCHEYKWNQAAWSLERRIAELEQNWCVTYPGVPKYWRYTRRLIPHLFRQALLPRVRHSWLAGHLLLSNVDKQRHLCAHISCGRFTTACNSSVLWEIVNERRRAHALMHVRSRSSFCCRPSASHRPEKSLCAQNRCPFFGDDTCCLWVTLSASFHANAESLVSLARFATAVADLIVWLARLCCCRKLKWKRSTPRGANLHTHPMCTNFSSTT